MERCAEYINVAHGGGNGKAIGCAEQAVAWAGSEPLL